MERYYDQLARYERGGFDIIVDKTWEDQLLRDCFDHSCLDIEDLERQVDSGVADWFMLRVRAFVDDLELGSAYLGGCLYEDPREVLRDGTAEDLILEAVAEAQQAAESLREKLDRIDA